MSSMLDQAIVDAAALRDAALKNAEQSIIEKYAPQIKEAVNSLLDKDPINEAVSEAETVQQSIEAPFAASPMADPSAPVELKITDEDQTWEFDLEKIKQEMKKEGPPEEEEFTETEDLATEMGLAGDAEEEATETAEAEEDLALTEIMNILNELDEDEEILEEELIVDMSGEDKAGWIETNSQKLKHQKEMELARMESTKYKEENEELEKRIKELSESISTEKEKNKKILQIVKKLDKSLNETLLSNAKLLYCNQTLSDASLNERQKNKIVEAIAKAKTPDEAKTLQETLKATVGTTKDSGPKSLSESVQRKSNLSGIMPRRKQPAQEYSFAKHMKKLAGIKT